VLYTTTIKIHTPNFNCHDVLGGMMKIGVFGGTFDPIHQGHLEIARQAQQQFALDKIFFVPAARPAHKSRQDMAPVDDRYEMVRLAIQGQPGFEISALEMERPETSYTVETLRTLKKRFPEAELYWIMGADSLAEIPTWKEPGEIKRLAKFLVARRSGKNMKHTAQEDVAWIRMPLRPVSATEIRTQLRQGASAGDVLPKPVAAYIKAHHLYGTI
jgi:nicotinate-nucleotide adenylyltransferase